MIHGAARLGGMTRDIGTRVAPVTRAAEDENKKRDGALRARSPNAERRVARHIAEKTTHG